ncbi:transposable element Tcb1 transposase [Trichonephila clavipes]|uniref:Transposable element Tcb1 transposase n=1 Tax=Trichonephila clavipes TaxID=2585209 RepID=A0A8X6VFJ2_TRICX|nr:transposable element Tcb1 transposase [Trichonephila clavipes]
MPRHGIQAHYEHLSEFKRGRNIGLKEAGCGQIGESLVLWVEVMWPLEDAGKNGWTMADFSIMMTCDPHTGVHHAHSQTVDRAKFTLLPTATPTATYACPLSSPDYSGTWLEQLVKHFLWSARSPDLSPIEYVRDTLGGRLHLPGNVVDLTQQLEQVWQEIPQETIRVLYQSMASRVAVVSRLEVVQHLIEFITL